MTVSTPQSRAIKSSCPPELLGKALAEANLQSIEDPDQRARVFMETITRLMLDHVQDKRVVSDLITARLERARRR
jgi:hypothetical protein